MRADRVPSIGAETLDPEELIATAVSETGLADFGDFPLREGLDVFCRALNREARLTATGTAAVRQEILATLVQRLMVEEHYRRFPDTELQRVVAPIVVTGLPRGGTTALSQMLSKDPALRSIRRWEANWPCPAPHPETEGDDPRVVAMRDALGRQLDLTPEYRTQLQVEANDPTEHYCFLRLTFQSHHLAGFYNVPSYGDWVLSCDMEPAYRYMLRVLKLLQTHYPPRRWNLKHPQDLYNLDALTAVFPDALLVWNHRDPLNTVPSLCSLVHTLRRASSDDIDKAEIGWTELERCRLLVARGMAYRDGPGAKQFHDVFNREILRDTTGALRDLYDRLRLPFTAAFEAALAERSRVLPKGKYGAHVYAAEDFGLDAALIDDTFAFYTSRFGLKQATPTHRSGES